MAPPSSRHDFLDGIRCVAICAVLCAHWLAAYTPFGDGGGIGVDVFFVLSGFIITTILWRADPRAGSGAVRAYVDFLGRRVVRLYPALLGLCVLGTLFCLIPGSRVDVGLAAERSVWVLGQMSWLMESQGTVMEPFRQCWSLASEWLFYLAWPVALLWAKGRDLAPDRLAAWTAGPAVVIFGCSLLLPLNWFYFAPVSRSGELLAGCALALWMLARPPSPSSGAGGHLAAGAALAFLGCNSLFGETAREFWVRAGVMPLTVIATCVLIRYAYTGTGGAVRGLVTLRPVLMIGRCSYSLYLWHWIPFLVLDKDVIEWPMPVLGVLALTSVAVLTALSYHYLERPFFRDRGSALRLQPGYAGSAPT